MDVSLATCNANDLLRRKEELLQELASVQHRLRRLGHPMRGLPLPLEESHVAGCRVFSTRAAILDMLPKGGRVAELGVAQGKFSKTILSRLQPAELHLFDRKFKSLDEELSGPLKEQGKVVLHEGDSSPLLNELPDDYFDFIYVDGDHTLEGVARDVAVAQRKLQPDGILGFNDYTMWSIREMIPYGVMHAVNKLCVRHGWQLLYLSLSKDGYHDVFVKRMTQST